MKKKILYIGNKLHTRGKTITSIETLGGLLEKEGFTVVSVSDKINKVARLLDMCLTLIKNRATVDYVLIDTYSTQNFYYTVIISWLCKYFHIDYIPILRGGNLPMRLNKNAYLSKLVFMNAKINVAPSKYLKTAFEKEGYTNVICIPNNIEIKDYPFLKRTLKPKLLWVRSFAKIYNPMLAIEVLEKLLLKYPEAQLCMVGPAVDNSFENCKTYSNEKHLPVSYCGKLSKKAWIERSKEYSIFLNTTNFDNTPISVIEAMALGLVVVSTNVGGIPYLLKDNENAILAPPEDSEALVKGVEVLLNNKGLAGAIQQQARNKAESFDWEIVKHHWFELLK